jgi:ABC-type transport system substrate-binding protein
MVNAFGEAGKNVSLLKKAVPGDPRKVKDQFPDLYEAAPSFDEQQPDKAEEALRKSGLSKENGTWVKPNGDPLVLELESFSWSRDDIATITEDLKEIGLQAEHVTQEQGVLFSREGNGDFALAQGWFFGLDGPVSGQALYAESGWPNVNQPNFYKIPPIGEMDAEPSETVDVRELASTIRGSSFEDHEEELRKLIWLYTYHQPQVHYARSPNASAFNRTRFKYPNYPEVDERQVSVATGDNAAPIWTADQAWRLVRRGLERPNHIMAREQYM